MERLTEKQRRMVETIAGFHEREERPPTTRELAEELGCHVKTVYQYILVLERKGYIERRKGRIHVARELRTDRGIPIVGRVAAGTPITAVENREGSLSVVELFGRDDVFAVRVEGDSMKDAGILDGDQVIVQVMSQPPLGAICVCYLGEENARKINRQDAKNAKEQEVIIRRLKKRGRGFELIPANSAYEPIRIAGDDPHFRIGGRVIGVVRRMK